MQLSGKVAVIVGGGVGIGRSIGLALAQEGADVAVVGRTPAKIEPTAAEITALGRRAIAVPADLTDWAAAQKMAQRTLAELGHIDVLVNSAGYSGPTVPVVEIPPEEWDRVQATNLRAVFLACKAVLPHLLERRTGSIISISGTAGKVGFPLRGALSAAKWGVLGFTQTLAMEVGPYGVRANAIVPGGVDGERNRHVLEERARALGTTPAEVEREFLSTTPLRRFVTPEELGAVCVFLASDASAAITGEALNVSAGQVMV